jgi:hypothetical protein
LKDNFRPFLLKGNIKKIQFMELDGKILVTGTSTENLIDTLYNLAYLYRETDFVQNIRLSKHTAIDCFLIEFEEMPDFDRFMYFVNFIRYPIGIEHAPDVRGYWTSQLGDHIIASELIDKQLMLFVSESDKEGDNITVVSHDNYSYTIPFAIAQLPIYHETPERRFLPINLEETDFKEIKRIQPDENKIKDLDTERPVTGCLGMLVLLSLSSIVGYLLLL